LDTSFVMVAHALTGSAVVSSGATALLSSKGSSKHKLAGQIFVASMLVMGPIVAAGAWFTPGSISSLGILFVFFMIYLVVSAWSTIRQSERLLSPFDIAAPVVALCISTTGLILGIDALSNPVIEQAAPPKEGYFFFAALASIAMLLDVNNIRIGGVHGKHRIVRHVWRMSCVLFFATSTLFTGPGSIVFSESVRAHPVLSIPQFLVVILALYWIYQLLFSKRRFSQKKTPVRDSNFSTNSKT
jgi:protein-S-isoprenylcysteine O-methyltransferase Ste14